MNTSLLLFSLAILALDSVFLILGILRNKKDKKLNDYVPVDEVADIPFGVPVVVHGLVVSNTPLVSPLNRVPCVAYMWQREEVRENVDSNNNKTYSTSWVQVEKKASPFALKDAKNNFALIQSNEYQTIDEKNTVLSQSFAPHTNNSGVNPLLGGILSKVNINVNLGNSNMGSMPLQQKEYILPTNSMVNVFGVMAMNGNQKSMVNNDDYPLIVTPLFKEELIKYRKQTNYYFGTAIVLAVIFLMFFTAALPGIF